MLRDALNPETYRATDDAAMAALLEGVSPRVLADMLLTAVRFAHQGLLVADLARLRGTSRRTLSRQLQTAHWPPAVEIIEWGRLLRAGLVSWREHHGVGALVAAAGFRNAQSLRRAAQRRIGEVGSLPSQLRPLQISAALRRRVNALSRTR